MANLDFKLWTCIADDSSTVNVNRSKVETGCTLFANLTFDEIQMKRIFTPFIAGESSARHAHSVKSKFALNFDSERTLAIHLIVNC